MRSGVVGLPLVPRWRNSARKTGRGFSAFKLSRAGTSSWNRRTGENWRGNEVTSSSATHTQAEIATADERSPSSFSCDSALPENSMRPRSERR